jgi:D-alanyl-D-alanine carboxypeptidase
MNEDSFVQKTIKMKRIILPALIALFNIVELKAQEKKNKQGCDVVEINNQYAKSDSLHAIMKRYVKAGLPGAAIALWNEKDGWWAGADGFSNTEKKEPMQNCNLQYLQSVSKTYMAVVIMQLYEKGKIGLDDPITKYLPTKYIRDINDAAKITVRMLLNHTSGISEFSTEPTFVSYVIQHPTQKLTTEFVLATIMGKPLMFTPGTRHRYSNTNYELLAVIADVITGDHAAFISKNIFEKLGLINTYYRNDHNYLKYDNLVDSYWDVLNSGRPANVTTIQRANVASYIGDDGMVCTPLNAVIFLKGLFDGKLVSDASLKEMQHWVNGDDGKPIYGLGLEFFEAGGITAIGHAGGGIGAGCILLYIPTAKTYIFISTNMGTLFAGDLPIKADQLKNELLSTILQ